MDKRGANNGSSGMNFASALLVVLAGIAVLGVLLYITAPFGGESLPIPVNLLPSTATVLLLLLVCLVTSVISTVTALVLAKALKPVVFRFFDSRWLPRVMKGERYETKTGERLERVVFSSFWATTVWELAVRIAKVLPSSVFVGAFLAIGLYLASYPLVVGIASAILVVFVVDVLAVLPMYLVLEWKRKHTKLVVFSTIIFYVKARTEWAALFVGRSPLTFKSDTRFGVLHDKKAAGDPEDLIPSFKTSWLHDVYIGRLASLRAVRTLYLPSFIADASDLVMYVENVPGLEHLIEVLRERSAQLSRIKESYDRDMSALERKDPLKPQEWSETMVRRGQKELQRRFELLHLRHFPVKEYDLFRVEDPLLYDADGNEIVMKGEESVKEAFYLAPTQEIEEVDRDLEMDDTFNSDLL